MNECWGGVYIGGLNKIPEESSENYAFPITGANILSPMTVCLHMMPGLQRVN